MAQTATVIEYGKISQFLSSSTKKKEQFFRGSVLDPELSKLLWFVRSGIEWKYDVAPAESTLTATKNYLYTLCGRFIPQAQVLIGNIGGTVIQPPICQTSTVITLYVQFVVGESGSLMTAGDTQLVLTYDDILLNSLMISRDTATIPVNLSNQFSYNAVYTSTNVTITFNEPVSDGQLFAIRFSRYVN